MIQKRSERCQVIEEVKVSTDQVNRTAMYAGEIATRFLKYVVTLGLNSGEDKILCGDLMFR